MKDLIIIGAGPAGLMAAFQAVQEGLSVTVIERKKDITVINRACSAQFVMDDNYEGEKLVFEDEKLKFTRNNFEVPYKGKIVPVYHNYLISPNGTKVCLEHADKSPQSLKFDKSALLKGLLDQAEEAGAEVLTGVTALDAKDCGEEGVRIFLKDQEKDTNFELCAKKLIIAEGVHCAIAEKMGLNEGRTYLGSPLIMNYTVTGSVGIPHNSWIQYYGKAYHPFAEIMVGESTECEDALEITVAGVKDQKPSMFFQKLLEDSPLSDNLKNIKIIKTMACSVKSYLSMETPYKGNVLVIGDSAAHIEVINQGAIMCGYHAARAVARELSGGDGFEAYKDWWNRSFMFNVPDKMGQLKYLGRLSIQGSLQDEEINYLFGILADDKFDCDFNQYDVTKHFWQGVKHHKDQISKEQPELYAKIEDIFSMV